MFTVSCVKPPLSPARILLVVCLSLFSYQIAGAQQDGIPEFDKLRTPVAPGFVLMGIAPTSVARPGAPTDLAVAVLSRTDNLSAVPKNFALEVSPYWLFSHPELTLQQYKNPGLTESILHTASVSVATSSEAVSGAEDQTTSLGVGLRFSILRGKASGKADQYQSQVVDILQRLSDAVADSIAVAIARNPQLAADTEALDRRKREIQHAVQADPASSATLADAKQELIEALQHRQGLSVELAGAGLWDFKNGSYDRRDFVRWGVWLTPALNFENGSLVAVCRYVGDDLDPDDNLVDVGVSAILVSKKYAFSLEGVARAFVEGERDDQHRVAFTLDYEVGTIRWLTVTFGRDFDVEGENSLIALANLSFGFGGQRQLDASSLK
ncbi:MAG TPA: hypothetical protein VM118_09165 [Acidobacteriota bacterium]|nr:hypothetical protein [Acidobacteriota bacterium]